MDWTEFNKRFPTEESCRNYLFKKKWTDGFFCPKCECKNIGYLIHININVSNVDISQQ